MYYQLFTIVRLFLTFSRVELDKFFFFFQLWHVMMGFIYLFGIKFRFELDMLLESVSSATKRAEELLNSINENNVNLETPFHIEDNFTGWYLLA